MEILRETNRASDDVPAEQLDVTITPPQLGGIVDTHPFSPTYGCFKHGVVEHFAESQSLHIMSVLAYVLRSIK
jgi:hypothetical protein